MEKNELLKIGESVFRILGVFEEKVLAIDCMKKVMPCFLDIKLFENAQKVETLPCSIPDMEDLTPAERAIAQERFTMIAGGTFST